MSDNIHSSCKRTFHVYLVELSPLPGSTQATAGNGILAQTSNAITVPTANATRTVSLSNSTGAGSLNNTLSADQQVSEVWWTGCSVSTTRLGACDAWAKLFQLLAPRRTGRSASPGGRMEFAMALAAPPDRHPCRRQGHQWPCPSSPAATCQTWRPTRPSPRSCATAPRITICAPRPALRARPSFAGRTRQTGASRAAPRPFWPTAQNWASTGRWAARWGASW